MKLQRFSVTNFRSVNDSGWIPVDDVTTLVGINESGKSNILLALWKLNPVSGGKIDPLHDLPVSRLAELRNKLDETSFIEAYFSLDESAELFKEKFGIDFASTDEIFIQRFYDGNYHWEFCEENKDNAVFALTEPSQGEKEQERDAEYTLEELDEIILAQLPGFVYYSNYGNLASKVYLPHAVKWLNGDTVQGFEISEDQVRTLSVLFNYVNLKPSEILELGQDANDIAQRAGRPNRLTEDDINLADQNKEKRGLLLQSAGAKLTRDFKEWWKQGNYTFRFDTDGDYFRIWVSDEKRPDAVALELRSTGLQWFLSFFLVFLVECQGKNKNAILLLDEAGLTLHPMAQKDLSFFFNKLAESNPIVNTTHSPFIVDTDHIDRCRVVYTDNNGGTVVSENLREGSGDVGLKSIYAVHAALGLSVSDVMLQGCQVVIVEGVSDQFYLSAIKNVLIREMQIAPQREIVFAPAGGVKGVPGITSLVAAKNDDLPYVILDSDKNGDDFRSKLETGTYRDCRDKIISIKEITSIEQSEVEDMIPFSLIERKVQSLLSIDDEDEDSFACETGKPILPQIEKYALEQGIELEKGWKVELARTFNHRILGKKKVSIPEENLSMWVGLFKKLNV